MALALHGIGVSRGCAIGRAYILQRDQPEITEFAIPAHAIEDEVERFCAAVREARAQLRRIREKIPESVSLDIAAFIDTYLLMSEDSTLTQVPIALIRERQCNAEWALKTQRDRLVRVFEQMEDAYLRTRKDDLDHVVNRILRILIQGGEKPGESMDGRLEGRIIVADDLTPADTVLMQHQGISAFVTESGGPLSHTAILARNLGIPAAIGVRRARRYLRDDDTLVVDGQLGVVLATNEPSILDHYQRKKRRLERERNLFKRLRPNAAITQDGFEISLQANIELPGDIVQATQEGATGVGLYRTEYLFMNRSTPPDEEEHLSSYLEVVNAFGGRPVTIRTLDLGADKQVDGGRAPRRIAYNPALGLRAIRLCLKNLDLFRPQLRAILRASAAGPVRLLIPMVSSFQELRQVSSLLQESMHELAAEGHRFDPKIPVGAMVEVPAAAISAPFFARSLDFLSIGTNDLIQYTLAIDRIDDEVNYLYDPVHPAVLRLIHDTIAAGREAGIPVSLCGEMAGEPRYTRLLLALGLTELSMHPQVLLEIKEIITKSHMADLRVLGRQILACTDPNELSALIARITH